MATQIRASWIQFEIPDADSEGCEKRAGTYPHKVNTGAPKSCCTPPSPKCREDAAPKCVDEHPPLVNTVFDRSQCSMVDTSYCLEGTEPRGSRNAITDLDRLFNRWAARTAARVPALQGLPGQLDPKTGNCVLELSPPSEGSTDTTPQLFYNSRATAQSPDRPSWSAVPVYRVTSITATFAVVSGGTGTILRFTDKGVDNRYQSPPDTDDTLTFDPADGGWTQRRFDGAVVKYDNSGRSRYITMPGGRRWTMVYDGTDPDQQRVILDPFGRRTSLTYDGSGRITGVVQPSGRRTTYVFNGSGNLTGVTSPDGSTRTLSYDAFHQLTGYTDASGRQTQFAYDGDKRVTRIVRPDGGRVTLAYLDAQVRVVDPTGRATTLTYSDGYLRTVVDPLGARTTYAWSDGRMVGHTDPLGNQTAVSYTSLAGGSRGTRSVQEPGGGRYTFLYDGNDRFNAVIDPFGRRNTLLWDGAGNRIGLIDAYGGRTTYSYNAFGQVTAALDPAGRRTSFVFDQGRRIATIDGLGLRTTLGYTATGQIAARRDPLGRVTTHVYDDLNHRRATISPSGARTSYSYDPAGRPTATTDALGNRTTTTYDAAGRRSAEIDPLGRRTTYTYHLDGQIRSVTDGAGRRTTTVYDAAGRPAAVIDPLGLRSTTLYDPAGRPVAAIDPLGRRNSIVFAPSGLPAARIDPLGRRTSFSYDAALRPATVTDPLGSRSTTVYDARGAPAAVVNPLGLRTSALYDGAGLPLATIDPTGARVIRQKKCLEKVVQRLGGAVGALARRDAGEVSDAVYGALEAGFGPLLSLVLGLLDRGAIARFVRKPVEAVEAKKAKLMTAVQKKFKDKKGKKKCVKCKGKGKPAKPPRPPRPGLTPCRGQCFRAGTRVWLGDGASGALGSPRGWWLGRHVATFERGEPGYAGSRRAPAGPAGRGRERVVWLVQEDAEGRLEAALVRSTEWLAAQGVARVGDWCALSLPEMGAVGRFQVVALEDAPDVPAGPGARVTGEFHHGRGRVYNVWVEGEAGPLGVTARHPVMSADRGDWVPVTELRIGERVWVRGGTRHVLKVEEAGDEPVFNLEVDADHCYRVGEQGILVHNDSAPATTPNQPEPGCVSALCNLEQSAGAGRVSAEILRLYFKESPDYLHRLACLFSQEIDAWIMRNRRPATNLAVAVALVCNLRSTQSFEIWISSTYNVASGTHPIQETIQGFTNSRYQAQFRYIATTGAHAESNIVSATNMGSSAIIIGVASSLQICTGCQGLTPPPHGGFSLPHGVELLSPPQPSGAAGTPSTCRSSGANKVPISGIVYLPAPLT